MAKAPAFQFYVKDWLSDTALQSASSSTRGIWINMICRMWWNETKAEIRGNKTSLCRLLNCTNRELNIFFRENDVLGFCYTSQDHNGTITIINRRMQREEKRRQSNRLRQKRWYAEHKPNDPPNADITLPSPVVPPILTPSPEKTPKITPKKKEENKAKEEKIFDEQARRLFTFWKDVMNHPGAKFDNGRKKKIIARLKNGYTEEECKLAIQNVSKSAWHMGDNKKEQKYNSINLIFRNGEKLEGYINLVPHPIMGKTLRGNIAAKEIVLARRQK